MRLTGVYTINKDEDYINGGKTINNGVKEEKVLDFEDAIELTGNGWYNRGLLATLSLALLGMGIDMFGFSVVVTGCSCDFQLTHGQKSIMLSMPFIGPILTALTWGYVSDTQGRRKTLFIVLWGSFIISAVSAFSTNWIMLTVLKMLSSGFSSAIQSCAYAFLSESCSSKVRGFYMLIMTSVLMLFMMSYILIGYFILGLEFAFNLGVITFTPWRALVLVLTLPLLISGFFLQFFYESPKFLANSGQGEEALKVLKKIWLRNGGNESDYQVDRISMKGESSAKAQKVPLMTSLWSQTVPLFKLPLLWTTLQLFFLCSVIYGINTSLVMWMPYIVEAFTTGVSSGSDEPRSLCSIIVATANATSVPDEATCSSSIQYGTLSSALVHGILFATLTAALSKLASRRKLLTVTFLLIPLLCTVGAIFNQNNVVSLVLYVGMTMTNLCMGMLFSYFVDLYPTSYGVMAACLGVLVARLSGLGGVNFVGALILTHCTETFAAFCGYLLCGIFVAIYYLPPDRQTKKI